jgi:hypothetical protein
LPSSPKDTVKILEGVSSEAVHIFFLFISFLKNTLPWLEIMLAAA